MSLRRTRQAAGLAALAVAAGFAVAAPASAYPARACQFGGVNHQNNTGPPGSETIWLANADNPPGCEQYRAQAVNSAGTWYSGWISHTGVDATTNHQQQAGGLISATLQRQAPGGGNRACKRVYPTEASSWSAC